MSSHEKLQRCISAYRRRFGVRETDVVTATMGGGGYAYVKNERTDEVARFDVSAWRVRYVDLWKRAEARSGKTP